MVAEAKDLDLISQVLEKDDLSDAVRAAFEDMQFKVDRYPLTRKQRDWARAVISGDKYEPEPDCLNLWSSGLVPKGKDVPTPEVLKHLPKKPPARRPVED